MNPLTPSELAHRLGISERRLRRLVRRYADTIPHLRTGRALRFPPEAEEAVRAYLTPALPPNTLPAPATLNTERQLLTDLIHTQARVMERLAAALEQRPQAAIPALPPTQDLEARIQALAHELARQGERIYTLEKEMREALAALRDDMEKCQFWSKRLMLHLASKSPSS